MDDSRQRSLCFTGGATVRTDCLGGCYRRKGACRVTELLDPHIIASTLHALGKSRMVCLVSAQPDEFQQGPAMHDARLDGGVGEPGGQPFDGELAVEEDLHRDRSLPEEVVP